MTKNDWKYVIKRVLIYFIIALIMFIFGIWKADAKSVAPSILQFYKPNATDTWNRSPVKYTRFGQDYYTTSVSSANDIAGIYGISNNQISGSYVSFTMLKGQPVPSVTAYIQLLDSSFMSCEIVTDNQDYADGTYYTAKCNVGNSQQIYKYGFQWSDSQGYVASENSILISKINAFDNEGEYNTYLNNLNSSINAASSQAHQDAQQAHQDAQQAHQDAQDINNTLKDDSAPSSSEVSGNTSDWSNNNANNGVINQLLLMPITLLQSFVNGINSTCSTYTLGELWGTNLDFPCINLGNILGSLWTLIDVIMSGIFIFIFGKRCVRIFNDFTNLKGGQVDQLYGGDN